MVSCRNSSPAGVTSIQEIVSGGNLVYSFSRAISFLIAEALCMT